MANLPSLRDYINDLEVSTDKPLSEALLRKFGGNINYILDKEFQLESFTSNTSYEVPSNVFTILVAGVGAGGGGGAGGNAGGGAGGGGGGGGGAGHSETFMVSVTPGETLDIVIGAGGTGGVTHVGSSEPGFNGSAGSPTYIKRGNLFLAVLPGGYGGYGGGIGTVFAGGVGGQAFLIPGSGGAAASTPAIGWAGAGGGAGNGSGGAGNAGANSVGGASGGAGGNSLGNAAGGGGGAGGDSSFGPGGAGGRGRGDTIPATNGGSPSVGSYGAGGGGGGGGLHTGGLEPSIHPGTTAGNGAPGMIQIAFFVVP